MNINQLFLKLKKKHRKRAKKLGLCLKKKKKIGVRELTRLGLYT
jgi:hypothetical protein